MKKIFWACLSAVLLLCSACTPSSTSEAGTDTPPVVIDSTDIRPMDPPDAPYDAAPADTTPPDADIQPDTSTSTQILPPMETYRGTFVEMQEGDYLHFVMKDEAGKKLTFWVSPDMPQAQFLPFLDGLQKPGTQVEVKARRVTRRIPEAGSDETFDEAYEIYALE